MRKGIKQNSTILYAIILTVVLLLANTGLAVVLMNQSSSSIRTLIQYRMLDITNTAADMINGEITITKTVTV